MKDRPKFQAIQTILQNVSITETSSIVDNVPCASQIRYEQVMTVKECPADDEDDLLSYRVHEVITVIDK